MSDSTMSDADKIRQKRLAKLGGNDQPSTPPAADNTTDQPAAKENKQSTPVDNPFSQVVQKQDEGEKKTSPQIKVTPRPASPAKRVRDGSEKPRAQKPAESLDTWQDRNLRAIFRITLNESDTRDAHGNKLIYLPSTKNELEEQFSPVQMNMEVLEGAITEAASHAPGGKPFEYLLASFKRVSKAIRGTKHSGDDPKHEILSEARRLCMSYCIFAVTMPEMFESTQSSNPLVDHLLADPECDTGICSDFLTEATNRMEEDDSIKEAIVGAAEELSRQLSQKTMLDDYTYFLRGLRNLMRFPKIVEAVTQSALWLPDSVEAQDIEKATLLGPFFRLSPIQAEVAENYFSAPRTRDRGFIANAQNASRLTLRTHQQELFELANNIVRAGPAPRERVLNWFALCVNKNHKKRAMRVDHKVVSGDGFMINITSVLDQLCEPFMDARFGKIDRIDVDYLRRNPRVDIQEETKINADQKASDEFYAQTAEGTNNFISEIFFLTVAAHHYGTEAAQTKQSDIRKMVQRMEKQLEEAKEERKKYSDPRYLARFDEGIARYKKQIDSTWSVWHATHGILMDDLMQARSMQFMRYVIVWLMRLASTQNLPQESLRIPLPEQQPDVFRFLPEYFLEDITDNFKFITNNLPHILTPHQCEEIVQICVTFLRNSEYVKNVGVKSGLVTILFYGCHPSPHKPNGVLGDLLMGSDFANRHLLHALMRFYIEAESTGSHTQFFDKFNIRYEIFQIVKAIWPNTLYRENLAKEARVNTDFFVQFVNMLVNDVTFVLDETLSGLVKIHDLTLEVRDQALMATLTDEQKQEKNELLEDHKGRTKSYMGLTTETMEMLILFSESLADSFTMPEIVTRLADMLDYNLDTMVGPKSTNLKVENMQQEYNFNPKALLSDIMTVYVNLSAKQNFISAIARDARSYKPSNFERAATIMKKNVLKSPEEIRTWENLAAAVAKAKALEEEEEQDLGEVPDEFMDPLMFDLMKDPVILPTSKSVMDRSTIRSHLLSDPTDPFNRMPLKIEEVVPDVELKAKIDAWIGEKRGAKANKGEAMDTS